MWETGHRGTSISAWWHLGPVLLRQSLMSCTIYLLLWHGPLRPTFWGCTALSPLNWQSSNQTLVCDYGFHCQHMHCTSFSCWKPQLSAGCDTLCGRTGDICSLQPFLWRKIKTAFLDLCACAGAAAWDRVGEVYLTKHPQVHSIQIHSRAIKAYFQDVEEGKRKERGGWKSPWLHTDRAWP